MTISAPPPGSHPARLTAAMAEFATFLAAHHTELPLGHADPFTFFPEGDDDTQRTEVNRIAAILGVTPADPTGHGELWECARDFGGALTYRAVAITAARLHAHRSHQAACSTGTDTVTA